MQQLLRRFAYARARKREFPETWFMANFQHFRLFKYLFTLTAMVATQYTLPFQSLFCLVSCLAETQELSIACKALRMRSTLVCRKLQGTMHTPGVPCLQLGALTTLGLCRQHIFCGALEICKAAPCNTRFLRFSPRIFGWGCAGRPEREFTYTTGWSNFLIAHHTAQHMHRCLIMYRHFILYKRLSQLLRNWWSGNVSGVAYVVFEISHRGTFRNLCHLSCFCAVWEIGMRCETSIWPRCQQHRWLHRYHSNCITDINWQLTIFRS